jgi:hypothetical protein
MPDQRFATIRLLDERGRPVQGAKWQARHPDGKTFSGATGADGSALVPAPADGVAQVTLPEVDKRGVRGGSANDDGTSGTNTVRALAGEGDCVSSMAYRAALPGVMPIWGLAENGQLRAVRTNPNLLVPGDEVYLPQPEPKTFFVSADEVVTLSRLAEEVDLELELFDDLGHPWKDEPYELTIEGVAGDPVKGQTDAGGRLKQSVPATANRASLKLKPLNSPGYTLVVRLGTLEPATTARGIQARLSNLGFPCDIDGSAGPKTRAALRAFQAAQGLQVTGEVSDATRSKLSELHGS